MAVVKQKLNSMRVDFHQATTKNKNLQGEGIYSDMSVDDLEALEKTLEYGLSRVRTELRQQYRRAIDSERETCIICLHERVSIVVMPCRHRVLCATCAVRIQMCPVDRQEITDMFPTFGR
ncbi:Alpha/beta hydrolase domain-containing protein 4 [Aphanomyces cochlioides]|nr:Alpha/beta hydrolase domain-containing protein 4 [Aphanomyces cochlioides]